MASYSYNTNSSFSSTFPNLFDQFLSSPGDFNGNRSSESTISHSLILDSDKGELVEAPARLVKKGASEEKTSAALKNHCEAERRRRERINSHLSTLRGLIPCSKKMEKAALLAEVVREVKELKKKAEEACNGVLIPVDYDEVKVEECANGGEDGSLSFKATLCCDHRPEILSDLRQSLNTLCLKMVKAELSTVGSRVKTVFIFTTCKEEKIGRPEAWQCIAESIRQALNSVLDKAPFALDDLPWTTRLSKRRRLSFYDTSSSSSGL